MNETDLAAAQRRWELARRTDLADALGMMLSVPDHGQDENGIWRYGPRSRGGMASSEIESEFQAEMNELMKRAAFELVTKKVLTAQQVEAFESQRYSVGPAAQEWPQLFFDFYQSARPLLEDGATLLTLGYFLKDVYRLLRDWSARKERELFGSPESKSYRISAISLMPSTHFTRSSIVALCFSDVVQRHGVGQSITVESFSRSPSEFETVDHPSGRESYLIRIKSGRLSYFYQVSGTAEVSEHYLLASSAISLLPLPDFFADSDQIKSRRSGPSQEIRVEMKRDQ